MEGEKEGRMKESKDREGRTKGGRQEDKNYPVHLDSLSHLLP